VFPIVFPIGGAYNRREAALVQYGIWPLWILFDSFVAPCHVTGGYG
jgi:hypothetical protein